MKHLIVIAGPTASGKTALSIALAKHYNTCIVSADSRQFYKEMAIGTAKPDQIEQDGVKHYFIDSHKVTDEVTSARYEMEALELLEKEFQSKDIIILTGGSGMFIDALCIGLDNIPTDQKIKAVVQSEYEANGLTPLLEELKTKDPEYYEKVDRDNAMRIQRAIEVIRLTGKTYTELRQAKPKARPFQTLRFVIDHPREVLYDRINRRVDIMMNQGLLDEVKSVANYRHLASLNTVGYKELFAFLDGHCTLEEATEKIKQNTRRYAKRQLTWFRRHPESHWIKHRESNQMIQEIIEIVEQSKS